MTNFSELYSLNKTCNGSGINHENQNFRGSIHISPVAAGKGLRLEFKAIGNDDTVFHEEASLIGPSHDGKPCLFVLSNNHPGVTPHPLKREDKSQNKTSWIFGFGDVNNASTFREEIALELWNNGSVEYTYFWGLPGGEFKRRSGVRMSPLAPTPIVQK